MRESKPDGLETIPVFFVFVPLCSLSSYLYIKNFVVGLYVCIVKDHARVYIVRAVKVSENPLSIFHVFK